MVYTIIFLLFCLLHRSLGKLKPSIVAEQFRLQTCSYKNYGHQASDGYQLNNATSQEDKRMVTSVEC
uniref:Secreted protein n=1 Tax=Saccharum officinarum TaxID=4547 RepID=A0A678TH29_SACOF|nr:hypothetical protein SO169D19_000002 [Saccharum officinarum]